MTLKPEHIVEELNRTPKLKRDLIMKMMEVMLDSEAFLEAYPTLYDPRIADAARRAKMNAMEAAKAVVAILAQDHVTATAATAAAPAQITALAAALAIVRMTARLARQAAQRDARQAVQDRVLYNVTTKQHAMERAQETAPADLCGKEEASWKKKSSPTWNRCSSLMNGISACVDS